MEEIYRSPWFILEGYLACTVKYANGTKRTVLQHREVMEKKLGRKLKRTEIVHHKNNRRRDNVPRNLTLKTPSSHARLHAAEHPAELISLKCFWCGKQFTRPARFERHLRKQNKAGPFCGKSCVGQWTRENQIRAGMSNLRSRVGTR